MDRAGEDEDSDGRRWGGGSGSDIKVGGREEGEGVITVGNTVTDQSTLSLGFFLN